MTLMTTFGDFFPNKCKKQQQTNRQKTPLQNPTHMHYYAFNNLKKRFGLEKIQSQKKKDFE